MNTCLIKQVSRNGQDPKVFRAYQDWPGQPTPKGSLKLTVSTTGHEDYAVRRCAVKVFTKHAEPGADPDEIETRIALVEITPTLWRARLEVKP